MRNLVKAGFTGICAFGMVAMVASIVAAPNALTSVTAQENSPELHNVAKTIAAPTTIKRKRPIVRQAAALLPSAPTVARTLLAVVDQPDIKEHHRILADRLLRTLPSLCRDNLKNFYVQYDPKKQRGLGGKTTIMVDGTAGDAEFLSLITHECGHVMHGNLLGNSRTGQSAFHDGSDTFAADSAAAAFFSISWTSERILKAEAVSKDFASGYAASDAFEDFAETFTLYVMHRNAFREQAKHSTAMARKLQWMEIFAQVPENSLGFSGYSWSGTVPWDATRLSLTLSK